MACFRVSACFQISTALWNPQRHNTLANLISFCRRQEYFGVSHHRHAGLANTYIVSMIPERVL